MIVHASFALTVTDSTLAEIIHGMSSILMETLALSEIECSPLVSSRGWISPKEC